MPDSILARRVQGVTSKTLLVRWILIVSFLFLSGCSNSALNFAPVTNGWKNDQDASQNYRVQKDDTLYSIAFRYGMDYRNLAQINNISAPYVIRIGQKLHLTGGPEDESSNTSTPAPENNAVVTSAAPSDVVAEPTNITTTPAPATPAATPKPIPKPTIVKAISTPEAPLPAKAKPQTTIITHQKPPAAKVKIKPLLPPPPPPENNEPVKHWLWPVQGKVIRTFSDSYTGSRGIDIAGKLGEPVHATASGKVVYCGSGLPGYGLLIILKHNDDFLSAYAHNSKALVKEGQLVHAGQTIALMGKSGTSHVMLHFEIRKAGKPVDPLDYLPKR